MELPIVLDIPNTGSDSTFFFWMGHVHLPLQEVHGLLFVVFGCNRQFEGLHLFTLDAGGLKKGSLLIQYNFSHYNEGRID